MAANITISFLCSGLVTYIVKKINRPLFIRLSGLVWEVFSLFCCFHYFASCFFYACFFIVNFNSYKYFVINYLLNLDRFNF